MNGIVLIDKPSGCTSHDVVNRWRRLAKTKRAGHLGTLDPMATGLLILVTGAATRLAQFYEGNDKTYEAEIRLGVVSDTFDADGVVTMTNIPIPVPEAVAGALARFRGRIMQTPPVVSAKKIHGVAAYKLARKQQPVVLAPVEVEVKQLDIHEVAGEMVRLTIRCSAGTYIRSIAHDLGDALGCGAILASLRRTSSGEFRVADARTLDQLDHLSQSGDLEQAVIPSASLLPGFPIVRVDQIAEARIRQGREFRSSPFVVTPGAPFVKVISSSGGLIAIGQLKFPNVYHPMIVF
jgi:tRNA pseudouridine55 synthase